MEALTGKGAWAARKPSEACCSIHYNAFGNDAMTAASDYPAPQQPEPGDDARPSGGHDAAPASDQGAQAADEPAGLRRLGLTPDQERAVTALLTEATVAKAAVAAGVSERSIYRWLREDEAFQRAYREAVGRKALGHARRRAEGVAPWSCWRGS